MSKLLYHTPHHFEIQDLLDASPSTASHADQTPFFTLDLLRQLAQDPHNRYTLREILAQDFSHPAVHRLDDREILRQTAWRLDTGYTALTTSTKDEAGIGGLPDTSLLPELPDLPSSGDDAPPKDNVAVNWITFQILSDDTEAPMPNVPLKLKLSDGSVGTYTSDAKGMIYITDLPGGTCDILEIQDDESLEIVDVTPA